MPLNNGHCKCGCGQITNIAKRNRADRNQVKGQPLNYIAGHTRRMCFDNKWNATKMKDHKGYIIVHKPDHPHSNSNGYIQEHRLIAEKAMGKTLPKKHIVHHVDLTKNVNINQNLVVCENIGYHFLLHQRTKAYRDSGNANHRKCKFCQTHDDPNDMYGPPDRNEFYHRGCSAKYQRDRQGL